MLGRKGELVGLAKTLVAPPRSRGQRRSPVRHTRRRVEAENLWRAFACSHLSFFLKAGGRARGAPWSLPMDAVRLPTGVATTATVAPARFSVLPPHRSSLNVLHCTFCGQQDITTWGLEQLGSAGSSALIEGGGKESGAAAASCESFPRSVVLSDACNLSGVVGLLPPAEN